MFLQARKALCALKGLVKLQALIRGHLVRRQATETLRCMQALVTAQARARAQRLQMAEEVQTTSQRLPNNRRSPQHPRFQQSYVSDHPASILLSFNGNLKEIHDNWRDSALKFLDLHSNMCISVCYYLNMFSSSLQTLNSSDMFLRISKPSAHSFNS